MKRASGAAGIRENAEQARPIGCHGLNAPRHKFRISGGRARPIVARAFPADLRPAAVNTLFFSGDFGEDRPQKKKISAPPRQ
jgi:hypothetical protein